MSLNKIDLHKYSFGEELLNSISHGIGALLSIAGLVIGLSSQSCIMTQVVW